MRSLFAIFFAITFIAGPLCAAKAVDPQRSVPDIPPGPGVITGRVVHEDPNRPTAGISVGLYSLAPDGQPSLRETQTDSQGAFRFENITNSPRTLYLIGARFDDIPYGKRVTFEPDTREMEVVIEIDDSTSDTQALHYGERQIELRWRGNQLQVEERHAIENTGERVVRVVPDPNAKPPLEVAVPKAATDFTVAFGHRPEYFERRDGRVLYWGPLHRGENQINFSYRLDAEPGEGGSPSLTYRPQSTPPPESLVVWIPQSDPEPTTVGFETQTPIETPEGSFRAYKAKSIGRPKPPEVVVTAPEQQMDPEVLTIPKADVILELDDSALDLRLVYGLQVAGSVPLVGSSLKPLLELEVPDGAEFLGLAPPPEEVGAVDLGNGRIAILGPLPEGESALSLHFRFPSTPTGAKIDLGFPRRITLLNVLVADTGVHIESDRLHRRRPMRLGTRLYLYREAFDIAAGERLPLRLERAERTTLPRNATRVAILGLGLLTLLFMLAPLRRSPEAKRAVSRSDPRRSEREALYEAIRDLEHDFETGKLSEADRLQLRSEIEARAARLIADEKSDPQERGLHCPACKTDLQATWTFCPECGATL